MADGRGFSCGGYCAWRSEYPVPIRSYFFPNSDLSLSPPGEIRAPYHMTKNGNGGFELVARNLHRSEPTLLPSPFQLCGYRIDFPPPMRRAAGPSHKMARPGKLREFVHQQQKRAYIYLTVYNLILTRDHGCTRLMNLSGSSD